MELTRDERAERALRGGNDVAVAVAHLHRHVPEEVADAGGDQRRIAIGQPPPLAHACFSSTSTRPFLPQSIRASRSERERHPSSTNISRSMSLLSIVMCEGSRS